MLKVATILFMFLLAIQEKSFGQRLGPKAEEIALYAYKLDTTRDKTDTLKFVLDSVQVKAQIQADKIVATCLFEQSKSLLTVSFYSREKNLVFIEVKEPCPTMNDLSANTSFYYEKEKLFDENFSWTVRPCMAIPMGKSIYEIYGYNPNLNAGFLKKFVLTLYNRLRLEPTSISL